ncbi:MAG: HAMP domain-containing sensor histidine kinase [Desulfobacteraceae bacterium]|jgi:signal transduction histidine kinase|nr:HAMP domain-containing sensor histidine kinase [Desulfobacteraceae bacterium]
MRRLKLLIAIFSVALSIPLAYFVVRTYRGLAQEEVATLRYFADTLFDKMEGELAEMVKKEEGRAIDEFNYEVMPSGQPDDAGQPQPSPLSRLPGENFILGYFQNNPDGSFQTPLVADPGKVSPDRTDRVEALKGANEMFNRKRVADTDRVQPRTAEIEAREETKQEAAFADRYIDSSRTRTSKSFLGQKEKRLEKITIGQAANITRQEQPQVMSSPSAVAESEYDREDRDLAKDQAGGRVSAPKKPIARKMNLGEGFEAAPRDSVIDADDSASFQVEVAPLQAVLLNDDQVFIFRRIMINGQIYRQGFVLMVNAFLEHLTRTYFYTQPMARFTGLRLSVVDQGREAGAVEAGPYSKNSDFILNRGFPSPFSFLKAVLTCSQIPRSAGRRTLNIMMIVLAVIVLIGLFAIYQSARAIEELSERRSQFVSSVTHELKTPLTNIRMYIEMLEQGIAKNPDREQEYFRILDSEGARLSRLINNVLEMSKLERQQRPLNMQSGSLADVVAEVETVMAEKLKQDGFSLIVQLGEIPPFKYDREVMIQVLINLIENSMKFGKGAPERDIHIRTGLEGRRVQIMVSDTGPGIPRQALKKIFNDFYRVENSLTRTTRGTGIGLALVRKFVRLMGGTVTAANNPGAGCTITISMPLS